MSDSKRMVAVPAATRVGKWVKGLSHDLPVTVAANRVLDARLNAVWHWLLLAASHSPEDVEYVHQLRVAARRAVAAIRIFSPLLDGPAADRMRATLRPCGGFARQPARPAIGMSCCSVSSGQPPPLVRPRPVRSIRFAAVANRRRLRCRRPARPYWRRTFQARSRRSWPQFSRDRRNAVSGPMRAVARARRPRSSFGPRRQTLTGKKTCIASASGPRNSAM